MKQVEEYRQGSLFAVISLGTVADVALGFYFAEEEACGSSGCALLAVFTPFVGCVSGVCTSARALWCYCLLSCKKSKAT